jgi:stringent starvation protein B
MTSRPPKKTPRTGAAGTRGGDGPPPAHPLVRAIEQLYAAGATPRLLIDARRADVVVPDFLRARWAEKLVIDLDASYPLDLDYDVDGVHATLAFSGRTSRCTFSWASIYRVIDRADGRGIVVPAHEPPAQLPPELVYGSAPMAVVTEVVEAKKPALSAVPPSDPIVDAPAAPVAAAPVSTSDEEAKARRAKFRVIEGG